VSGLSGKCGSLDVSQPYGPSRFLTGRALAFFFVYPRIQEAEKTLFNFDASESLRSPLDGRQAACPPGVASGHDLLCLCINPFLGKDSAITQYFAEKATTSYPNIHTVTINSKLE
jgi:hypothetical protein